MVGRRLGRRERAAVPVRSRRGASPSSSAAVDAASSAARAARGPPRPARRAGPRTHAVGHRARPRAGRDPPDHERIGQRELAHQRVRDVRVDARLVRLQRRVHRARSGRAPSSRPAGRRRARRARGTTPRNVSAPACAQITREAGRLGDQRGVERRVALELGERAEAAVLLRGHRLHDDRRARRRPRRPRPRRAARPPPRPSCRPRRGRAGARRARRPTTARRRHGALPGSDDVDVPVEAQPAGPRRRPASRRAPTAPRAAPPRPGGPDGAAAPQVVRVQVGLEAEPRRRARPATRAPAARPR